MKWIDEYLGPVGVTIVCLTATGLLAWWAWS